VYFTDAGRTCPACRQALADFRCADAARQVIVGDGRVRVSCEKAGRGGKKVTMARGLPLPADDLAALGKCLRSTCGTCGTVREGVLELQGDHAERVTARLQAEGFAAKRSGG
jgi:translation initiation factor 1